MALANITNNILTDSGILVTNLTPTTRTLTINGVTYDLSADRSWTIATGVGGSGTTNYLPKFTGTSTIGNSVIVDNGGNIGIGTASSAVELAVYSSSAARIQVQNSTSGTAFNDGFQFAISGSDGYLWNFENANIIFGTNNSAKMTLNASGNLGLGVTPSAWWSGVTAFQVLGASLLSSGNTSSLTANAFLNSTPQWIYRNTAAATHYEQSSGEHRWYNAPSGTAGNAISFTQAMTLDASGNLSIGTTSGSSYPYGGKLNVNGSISVSTGKIGFGVTDAFTAYGSSTAHYGISYNGSSNPVAISGYFGLGFFADGSEKMRMSASGNLSIGNTNDTYKLDVSGTGRFSAAVQINSNTTGLILNRNAVTNYNGIGYWTAGVGQWFVGMRENLSSNNYIIYNEALGTDVLTLSKSTGAATFSSSVTAGGDVNIPNGNYYYAKRSTGGANIGVLGFASGSDTLTIKGGTSGGSNSINFEDTGGIIASFFNGRLGIGTTSPSGKLSIYGSAIGDIPLVITHAWGGSSTALISASNASAEVFKVDRNGAATFSSSVTAATLSTIGTAVAGQNVQFNINGVSGKAQRIEFQNSGVQQWLIGAGAASETSAFEIFNSTGQISFSINKSTNIATFDTAIKTGAPSSGSAQPWKLGSYAAGGTGTATGVIYIEVNGQIYSIPALLGTP